MSVMQRVIFMLLLGSALYPRNVCFDNDIEMLTAFAASENKPTAVLTSVLCWTPYKVSLLAKTLHSTGLTFASSLQSGGAPYFLQHILIIADFSCDGAEMILINASRQGYFKAPYRWILLNLKNTQETILGKLDIFVDSDVIVARKAGSHGYLLTEVYKISESSETIPTTRAIWQIAANNLITHEKDDLMNNTTALSIVITRDKQTRFGNYQNLNGNRSALRRSNLRRHILTMAAVVADSNETKYHMDDRLNLHQDSISKMSYMVIHICFEMLNATEKLLFTHTWGYKDKNGSWQGLIDHLLKKEADLGTLTIFTQERLQAIEYIAMVGTTAVRFVFREPPLAYVANIFTLPFTGAVWMAIIICVLGCSLFIYIASKWEASMGMHPFQLDGSWADVFILIIGAVLQQGCTLEPRFAAGRCVTLLLFFALTILYSAYSANIVVLLRAPSPSVRTLQDLLHSPLKLGASDFEYNRYFFKKLNEPTRKAIYNKKIAPKGKKPNFYNMKDGVEKIRQGLFAFHMELNPGYRLIQETYQEHEKCDLVEIDYINEIDPWVPGQRRSPFKDLFTISFIKIRESGIQSCIHHRLHVHRPRCMGSFTTFSSIGITDMYPALLAASYGTLMALAVLLLEIAYHRLFYYKMKKLRSKLRRNCKKKLRF